MFDKDLLFRQQRRSNRTFMELKWMLSDDTAGATLSSNRTFMELKLPRDMEYFKAQGF